MLILNHQNPQILAVAPVLEQLLFLQKDIFSAEFLAPASYSALACSDAIFSEVTQLLFKREAIILAIC